MIRKFFDIKDDRRSKQILLKSNEYFELLLSKISSKQDTLSCTLVLCLFFEILLLYWTYQIPWNTLCFYINLKNISCNLKNISCNLRDLGCLNV